ncbi:MAG TPA: response regulator, partial [Methylophaga sp.]|nr:response regulator [Methylophaga sp.]
MAVKILIVEDDPVTQLQYSEILKKQGTVYLASSGEEAIILAMVVKPDVIFLDIELPGCNGFDVVQKLKSKQIPASVIMITAHNT